MHRNVKPTEMNTHRYRDLECMTCVSKRWMDEENQDIERACERENLEWPQKLPLKMRLNPNMDVREEL